MKAPNWHDIISDNFVSLQEWKDSYKGEMSINDKYEYVSELNTFSVDALLSVKDELIDFLKDIYMYHSCASYLNGGREKIVLEELVWEDDDNSFWR